MRPKERKGERKIKGKRSFKSRVHGKEKTSVKSRSHPTLGKKSKKKRRSREKTSNATIPRVQTGEGGTNPTHGEAVGSRVVSMLKGGRRGLRLKTVWVARKPAKKRVKSRRRRWARVRTKSRFQKSNASKGKRKPDHSGAEKGHRRFYKKR